MLEWEAAFVSWLDEYARRGSRSKNKPVKDAHFTKFWNGASPHFRRILRTYKDDDLIEEAISNVRDRLLSKGGLKYNRDKGSPKRYLSKIVRNEATKVWGQRRKQGQGNNQYQAIRETVPSTPDPEAQEVIYVGRLGVPSWIIQACLKSLKTSSKKSHRKAHEVIVLYMVHSSSRLSAISKERGLPLDKLRNGYRTANYNLRICISGQLAKQSVEE